MLTGFKIGLKNFLRNLVYRVYVFYIRKISLKVTYYDLETIRVIREFLPEDANCVDVGVNAGQIMYYLTRHCRKGKIMGFEPIPYLYKYLKKKYANSRVEIFNLVLSNTDGETAFFFYPTRPAVSSLRILDRDKSTGYEKISVNQKRLDDVFSYDRLDFIKIDVEGAEFLVLDGAREVIKKHKPLIILESGLGGMEYFNNTPEQLADLFESVGYVVNTMTNFINKKSAFSRMEFLGNFKKGYDYQYIAYPLTFEGATS